MKERGGVVAEAAAAAGSAAGKEREPVPGLETAGREPLGLQRQGQFIDQGQAAQILHRPQVARFRARRLEPFAVEGNTVPGVAHQRTEAGILAGFEYFHRQECHTTLSQRIPGGEAGPSDARERVRHRPIISDASKVSFRVGGPRRR